MLETMDTRIKAIVDNVIRPFDGKVGFISLMFEESTTFMTGVEIDEPFDLGPIEDVTIELTAYGNEVEVYSDENEYYERTDSNRAAESYIPCGLFRPDGTIPDEEDSPYAFMNGVVRIAEEHYDENIGTFYALLVECLGVRFTALVKPEELGNKLPSEGNIISGLFYIVGKIYEERTLNYYVDYSRDNKREGGENLC